MRYELRSRHRKLSNLPTETSNIRTDWCFIVNLWSTQQHLRVHLLTKDALECHIEIQPPTRFQLSATSAKMTKFSQKNNRGLDRPRGRNRETPSVPIEKARLVHSRLIAAQLWTPSSILKEHSSLSQQIPIPTNEGPRGEKRRKKTQEITRFEVPSVWTSSLEASGSFPEDLMQGDKTQKTWWKKSDSLACGVGHRNRLQFPSAWGPSC